MARKPRIHFDGAFHHAIYRGNNQQQIFFNDSDRRHYYKLLGEGVDRYGHRFHAACLMTNHVHLLVEVGGTSLSRILHNLSFRYAMWFNRTKARSGHLFQGRFQDYLVPDDRYFLALVRYIHMNPVRAGIVRDPADYRWSGHRAYLGRETLSWLTMGRTFEMLGPDPAHAFTGYRSLMSDDPEAFLVGDGDPGAGVGTAATRGDRREAATPTGLDLILAAVCLEYGLTREALRAPGRERHRSEARAVAAFFTRNHPRVSIKALAEATGRDPSTLSQLATRIERLVQRDGRVRRRIENVRGRIAGDGSGSDGRVRGSDNPVSQA